MTVHADLHCAASHTGRALQKYGVIFLDSIVKNIYYFLNVFDGILTLQDFYYHNGTFAAVCNLVVLRLTKVSRER